VIDLNPFKPYLRIAEWVAVAALAAYALDWHHGKVESVREAERAKVHAEMQPALDAMSKAVTDAQTLQAQAEADARKYHAELLSYVDRSTAGIGNSLQHIENTIRAGQLPCTVEDPSRPGAGAESASCIAQLAEGIGALRVAMVEAGEACKADTTELGTIIELARKNNAIAK